MNILAKATAIAGPRGWAAFGRVAVPASVVIAAVAALSGCSTGSPGTATTPAAHATPAATASAAPISAPTSPAPVATAAASPAATTAPSASVAPASGSLTAKVTILDTMTGLVPGGSPVRFVVTVTNNSTQTYGNILPLVSLSHCNCTPNTLFPAGTLQERESTSNVWQTIPYDVEGFGTDYLNVTEPGGIQMISPGATATFEYRVALKPATSAQVTRGMGAFDVTLVQLPGHTPIGISPAASAPVDVQSGQPPA